MNLRPQDKRNIIISGLFVSILTLVAMGFILMLGKEDSLFSRKFTLKTKLTNAQNLKEGSAVQLKGIKIGTIQSIDFENLETIVMIFSVSNHYLPFIKSDSYISIKTQGVLGDKFLEILGGSDNSPGPKDGDYIRTEEVNGLDKILSKGEDILGVTSRVLSKFDILLDGVEQDSISSLLSDIRITMKESKELVQELKKNNINSTIKNFSNTAKNLEQTTQALGHISKQIETGPGTIHSLIYEKSLYDDLASLLDGSKRNKVLKYFIRETIRKSEK